MINIFLRCLIYLILFHLNIILTRNRPTKLYIYIKTTTPNQTSDGLKFESPLIFLVGNGFREEKLVHRLMCYLAASDLKRTRRSHAPKWYQPHLHHKDINGWQNTSSLPTITPADNIFFFRRAVVPIHTNLDIQAKTLALIL